MTHPDPNEVGAAEASAILLDFMHLIESAALVGDPVAQPFLESDAVRIVDGHAEFHRKRFLDLVAEQMTQLQ